MVDPPMYWVGEFGTAGASRGPRRMWKSKRKSEHADGPLMEESFMRPTKDRASTSELPAAGFVATAVEAIGQITGNKEGFSLRSIELH